MAQHSLYVNPSTGQDRQAGDAAHPLKTLSEALRRSQPDTVIRLAAGDYTAATGETFPLRIGQGIQVIGSGGATRLQGSGEFRHAALRSRSLTCLLTDTATLSALTLTNAESEGIGLLIEAGQPQVNTIEVMRCGGSGLVILGEAVPTVRDSRFEHNADSGILLRQRGKGRLSNLRCRHNGQGIALHDQAAPLIWGCELSHNQTGVLLRDRATPVLRANQIVQNPQWGLWNQQQARPDLGLPQDWGKNQFRDNGTAAIRHDGDSPLTTCGNDLLPQQLQGAIELLASELPDPSAVPAPLLDAAAGPPPTAPTPSPPPSSAGDRTAVTGSQRFRDMADHWAGVFVDALAADGLVSGFLDGTFRPDAAVTRAQFAALVVASFPDQEAQRPAKSFQDVAADFWGAAALTQAYRRGFLSGYPDGTVRPQDAMTRIQAIVAIANGLGFSGGRVDDIGIYRDRAQVPSYAVDALAAATRRRLVVNYPDALTLRPLEPITRAEASALVYQGRVAQGLDAAITSPYIVRPDTTQPLFSDLSGHWAAAFIRGLAQANLVSGLENGEFRPDDAINRAQYAALLVKAIPTEPQKPATTFRDVPPDFWAHDAIQAAYRSGLMAGFPDQTFGPQHPLLRVQVWVSLISGLKARSPALFPGESEDLNVLGRFQDYTDLPRYALTATAAATRLGLVVNYPDPARLRPNQTATRGGVSATVYQGLVALGQLPAIASPYVVRVE